MLRKALAVASIVLCTAIGFCTETARGAQDPRSITLIDQRGTAFTLADLKGRRVAVTFVSTRCTDTCPISNSAFETLQRRLARENVGAVLVTITLDPAYDTPFVMSRLAREIGADPQRWRIASGSRDDVQALMRAFGIAVRAGKSGVPEEHSSFVFVLDTHTRLKRTLLLSTNVVDETAHALGLS